MKNEVVDSQPELETLYYTLIQMELLQRGVIVSNPLDQGKILESIRSTAGKQLLNQNASKVPLQLLAASAIMGGKVAEQCAKRKSDTQVNWDRELFMKVIERCRAVEEKRLLVLMNLIKNKESSAGTKLQISFLNIAKGFFLRAASFQSEAPPMWKRCWDVSLEIRKLEDNNQNDDGVSTSQAAYPLSNMARIAEKKGNKKRASELYVKLAESWLDATTISKKEDLIFDAFVALYQPAFPTKTEKLIDLSYQALEKCHDIEELPPNDKFLYKILILKIKIAREDTSIEEIAQRNYEQAKNRAKNASLNKQPIDKFLLEARDQILSKIHDDSIEASALQLLDVYLQFQKQNPKLISFIYIQMAAVHLRKFFQRSKQRLRAISLFKQNKTSDTRDYLIALTSYIDQILLHIRNYCSWQISDEKEARIYGITTFLGSISPSEVEMIEVIAELVPFVEWISCGIKPEKRLTQFSLAKLTCDLLCIFLKKNIDSKKKIESSSLVKSSTNEISNKIYRSECAETSLVCLANMMETNSGLDKHLTLEKNTAIRDDIDQYKSASAEYGTAYLQLLFAWSGLYETPWQSLNKKDADALICAARDCLRQASIVWGRNSSLLEQLFLDIAHADAEAGFLAGGFVEDASNLYLQVLKSIEDSNTKNDIPEFLRKIFLSHCLNGLAKVTLQGNCDDLQQVEKISRRSLNEMLAVPAVDQSTALYVWTASSPGIAAINFHISVSRQLVADILVRNGRLQEARAFFEDAVRDSPSDSNASFALGTFRLREVFLCPESSPKESKAAQTQLLRAARIDARKAGPFALLGIWFEEQKDKKRAIGCFSKALLADPANPVAGRGILRLTSFKAARNIIDSAISSNSPLCGWAWRVLGNHKAMVEGEFDLAVVALRKALRCKDIEQPQNERLSFFYSTPSLGSFVVGKEKADAFAELAFCYKQLGRYTAAIRAYKSCMGVEGVQTSASVLCSCAQVELDLGMLDEAAEKFKMALDSGDDNVKPIAAHGQGLSLLSISRREFRDGKIGKAFAVLQRAIEGCIRSEPAFPCSHKLTGDLYSFGASFPPDLFLSDQKLDETNMSSQMINEQVFFVRKGEESYRAAERSQMTSSSEGKDILLASIITDIGANIVLQCQIMTHLQCQHLGNAPGTELKAIYARSAVEFKRAIELNPLYAPAWCGLGCAVLRDDPLLAQHAFCRSVQLDSMSPDAYSNLSFLYTANQIFSNSNNILGSLTQIADTPMIWINRALILERTAAMELDEGHCMKAETGLAQAVDAYRAALQISRHPTAILGLALTRRVSPLISGTQTNSSETQVAKIARKESYDYAKEYLGMVSSTDTSASLIHGIMTTEMGVRGTEWYCDSLVDEGRMAIASCGEYIENITKDQGVAPLSNKGLDFNLLQNCILPADFVVDEREVGIQLMPLNTCLARQIVHQPNSGRLWLDFAKKLSKDIHKSKVALESARIAANRALKLLNSQLKYVSTRKGGDGDFNSGDLSDALSLVYWLDVFVCKHKRAEPKPHCQVALQKSILINPTNLFARGALKQMSI